MIKFNNVSKSFGDIKALSNVSFEVDKGEFVFITGPSGSGKTTLLRLILRELKPDSGHINFDGIDIASLASSNIPLLRQKIGVVFQDFKVLSERTVRENVEVALAVLGIAQPEWRGRVDKILDLVSLSNRSELFPSQLSGGELQRVSLARALVVNPKLILADEPTGNLDWDTSVVIIDLFEKINAEGKTVIMATHNKPIIAKYKKRVIEVIEGRVVSNEEKKNHPKVIIKHEEKDSDEDTLKQNEPEKADEETNQTKEEEQKNVEKQKSKIKIRVEEV